MSDDQPSDATAKRHNSLVVLVAYEVVAPAIRRQLEALLRA
jgi:hypothetical protein